MSAKSRRKGASYERELAREWRDSRLFPHAERGLGQSRSAAREGCDVEGTPYWVEAKCRARHESPWAYMSQAERDTDGRTPIVVMRAPRKGDLVVMRRADWEAAQPPRYTWQTTSGRQYVMSEEGDIHELGRRLGTAPCDCEQEACVECAVAPQKGQQS